MRLHLQLATIYGLIEAGFRDFSFLTASYIAMEYDSVYTSCATFTLAITAASFSLWGENQRCDTLKSNLYFLGSLPCHLWFQGALNSAFVTPVSLLQWIDSG